MARRSGSGIDDKNLTKGQLRKLNALRKSLGEEIANRAFSEWLSSQPNSGETFDKHAEMVAGAVMELVQENGLRIPRSGYLVRRGRGRVIVEPATESA